MPAFLKKGKFIAYIMIFIFVLFFTLDFGAVDLQKVAIVVTLGLDYETEDQNYILSGQIATTDPGSSFTATENQAVIYGVGKTPSMALKNMEDQSGWHPYISFCKLIIVSKSVFENSIMDALDFFLRNEQLNDTALICATEEKAVDILNSKTSLDEVSTFSLLKTLMYNGSENMNVVATNLKDFAIRFYNNSSGNVLTYIKVSESLKTSAEGEEDPPEEDEVKMFNPTTAAIFRKSEFVGFLTSEKVRAYNLITKSVKRGQIDLHDIQTADYFVQNCSVEIKSSKFKKAIYFEDNKIICDINLCLDFKIDHLESEEKNLNFLLHIENVPKEIITALENQVKKDIQSMVNVIKDYDADVFDIEETLFRFHARHYRKFKEERGEDYSFIKNTKFNITVSANVIS